ncbi:uncharacterized protein EI97DRAFT_440374 [Westerdykella ornata]|uniref:Uncharacterized protein n=1 Tax=Westerdykella ornata TaxID=318751 RepID=A0A6A6JQE0_WESOR|nr:uncharacterized protein EI97DRAFT_440374 [Westerdykella ornata]KAF2278860.1 hypothetical protein EI97DRAFT_440374 [Westerdykella ornata]
METIHNVAAAASKAIWGEQNTDATTQNETGGQEPISGEQGKGTPNEPFDQGNSEDRTKLNETGGVEPISGLQGKGTPNEPFDLGNSENPVPSWTDTNTTSEPNTTSTEPPLTSLPTQPSPRTEPTSTMSDTTRIPNNPINAATGDSDPYKTTEKTGIISDRQGDAPKAEDVIPTERALNTGAPPTSDTPPQVKHQGADAPGDVPSPDQHAAIVDKKDDVEELLQKRDPNDHSGSPMRMHDGTENTIPTTQEERRDSKAGMPGGQEHGKPPKGTGEQWVKSTGMAAEGGDFDATKPGAGREADRLMEEAGIKKSTEQQPTTSAGSPGTKEKEKLSEKIKHKLHIGKNLSVFHNRRGTGSFISSASALTMYVVGILIAINQANVKSQNEKSYAPSLEDSVSVHKLQPNLPSPKRVRTTPISTQTVGATRLQRHDRM